MHVVDANLKEAEGEIVKAAADVIAAEARGMIGHENPGWPPLKPETIAHKAMGNTPLLETGELRSSISSDGPYRERGAAVAYAGSTDEKSKFHEFGTSHVPPRPFLGAAMKANRPMIEEKIEEAVAATLALGELRAVAHVVHQVFETVKKFDEEMSKGGDESRRR